ncbi:YybH family protein, partial [Actinosynnema sp.]|uniref:YybH family protein n=1 Tax=Actinosynnema sp. TaxID=1872144 RepID=UPI003F82D183
MQGNDEQEQTMTDEQQIRDLIERWAAAVHDGDLATVLADHAPDLVVFDVPPPERGVRGIADYRGIWPGFFEWQASGAVFEIEALDVTARADVAYAVALLRCGTPSDIDRDTEHRLRLTIGLTKVEGRWVVAHEHHSFADATGSPEVAGAEVAAVHERWFERTAAKDLDGLIEHIAPDVVSYEHAGPLQHVGIDAVREVCGRGLLASPGRIDFDVPDLTVRAHGDLAVAWGLDRVVVDGVETRSRGTRVFQRRDGDWRMVHQ